MKRLRQIIPLLFGALLLTACTKEELNTQNYNGETSTMGIGISKAPGNASIGVKTIRAIVFSRGKLVSNTLKGLETTDQAKVMATVALGENNFYVFCNETADLATKLQAVASESAIEDITFEIATATNLDFIPMYGKVRGAEVGVNSDLSCYAKIDGTTYTEVTVPSKRLMASVKLTLIKDFNDPAIDITVLSASVKIRQMPTTTYIKASTPCPHTTNTAWASDITVAANSGTLTNNGTYTISTATNPATFTVPAGVDYITTPDIYIPEHIFENPLDADNNATYLEITTQYRMKMGSSQVYESTYFVKLGQNPPANHNIVRNNQYNIYATITSMGAMGIYADIVPMDMFNVPVNWRPTDGLVIVSEKEVDLGKDVNVWDDYATSSGILKVFYSDEKIYDVMFKYGSLIAIQNDVAASVTKAFLPPTSTLALRDVYWYPSSFGNPYTKGVTSWGAVPYLTTGSIDVNTDANVRLGLGDPCQLVGLSNTEINGGRVTNGQWRMATEADYGIVMNNADNDANSVGYRSFHQNVLPNVKIRDNAGQLAAAHNGQGVYWSATGTKAFGFTSITPAAALTAQAPEQAFTVRCVRTNIAPSRMLIFGDPIISWNSTTGSSFKIETNIPYWTATLITDTDDPDYPEAGAGNTADFSFQPGATNVTTTTGKYTQNISVYAQRWESLKKRIFNIRVTGQGVDGVTVTRIVSVTQWEYQINFADSYTPALSADDNRYWIPKAGASYTGSVTLTPLDISIKNGIIYLVVKYNGVEVSRSGNIATTPGTYTYTGFDVTIPANDAFNLRGLEFKYFYDAGTEKANSNSLYYYQN